MAANSVPSSDGFESLKRFLYFGRDGNHYEAAAEAKSLTCLMLAFSRHAHVVSNLLAEEKGVDMVEKISKFLTRNTVGVSRYPALYALAMCARHSDKDFKTKQAAMKVFVSDINTSADLFTFISIAVHLKKTEPSEGGEGGAQKKGWGRSLKNAVRNWFDKRDALTLAKIVTEQKTACHWSYVDLLRVTHICPQTEGAKMMTKYLVKGLKAAREEFGGEKGSADGGDDTLQKALDYLAALEQLKEIGNAGQATGGGGGEGLENGEGRENGEGEENTEESATATEVKVDSEAARTLVEQHSFSLHQLVFPLQIDRTVLNAVVQRMSLPEILESISHLARYKMMDSDSPYIDDLVKKLEDHESLKNVSPISLLLAKEAYEFGGTQKMKWVINNTFMEALRNSFMHTLKTNVKPTSKRYLLAVNINRRFAASWTHGIRYVRPCVAAAGLCMSLVENEKSVEVVTFDTQVKPMEFKKGWTTQEFYDAFYGALYDPCRDQLRTKLVADMSAPLVWATQEKKAFDAIIIMTDFRRPKPFEDFSGTFKKYKEAAEVPKTKLVMVGLTAVDMTFAVPDEPNMLDIVGFDHAVPNIIQGFVTDSL